MKKLFVFSVLVTLMVGCGTSEIDVIEAYNQGLQSGEISGFNAGYDKGKDAGYNKGVEEGKKLARQELTYLY